MNCYFTYLLGKLKLLPYSIASGSISHRFYSNAELSGKAYVNKKCPILTVWTEGHSSKDQR